MNTRRKYLIMMLISVVLCAVIIAVNFEEYRESKTLVVNEIYAERKITYSGEYDQQSSADLANTININTATAQELADFLPGIGAVKAESIVAYREAIGGFRSVEELIEVKGIGEATMNSIREYCRVSDDQ